MTAPTDERQGWTSASNALADSRCPGRHLAQRELPQSTGLDAEFGTAIHRALAASNPEGLTAEQLDIYESCQEIEQQLVLKVFGPDAPNAKCFREQRYWLKVKLGESVFPHSGRLDCLYRAGKLGLVLEYKTLPGEQQDVDEHAQLRDQAVLAAGSLILTEVACAIIQPLVTHEPELVLYDATSIKQAEKELFERVIRSNDPASVRIAGAVQCRYCAARDTCLEHAKWASQNVPAPMSVLDVPVAQWTPEQRTLFCERKALAQAWLDECEAAIKTMLAADPNCVPGYALKPGAVREVIKDAQELFNRFAGMGGDLDQFMDCVSIGKEKLEAKVRAVTQTKGKGLKAKMEEILQGITETRPNAPSIAKIK